MCAPLDVCAFLFVKCPSFTFVLHCIIVASGVVDLGAKIILFSIPCKCIVRVFPQKGTYFAFALSKNVSNIYFTMLNVFHLSSFFCTAFFVCICVENMLLEIFNIGIYSEQWQYWYYKWSTLETKFDDKNVFIGTIPSVQYHVLGNVGRNRTLLQ